MVRVLPSRVCQKASWLLCQRCMRTSGCSMWQQQLLQWYWSVPQVSRRQGELCHMPHAAAVDRMPHAAAHGASYKHKY
jgi:hypothetical protein